MPNEKGAQATQPIFTCVQFIQRKGYANQTKLAQLIPTTQLPYYLQSLQNKVLHCSCNHAHAQGFWE